MTSQFSDAEMESIEVRAKGWEGLDYCEEGVLRIIAELRRLRSTNERLERELKARREFMAKLECHECKTKNCPTSAEKTFLEEFGSS